MAGQDFEEGYLRRIIIRGTISEATAISVLKQLTVLEHVNPTQEVQVWISSYGGSVAEAFSIVDMFKSSSCPIKTVGTGKVMSAASLLLAAGDKGNRFITQNTRVMTHMVPAGMDGTTRDMEVFTNEIKYLQDEYLRMMSEFTGQSKEKLLTDINSDFYMSAQEAVKYGMADGVLPYNPAKLHKKVEAKKQVKVKKKKK